MSGDRTLNAEKLRATTRVATRALDNVVDMVNTGVARVDSTSRANRRLGLGIMGLADMLVRQRVGYATERGRSAAAEAMRTINVESHAESRRLAAEKGSFQNIEHSIYASDPHRNAALLTIAPTGTISNLIDVSGGVEPLFALSYRRVVGSGANKVVFSYVNDDFKYALCELEDEGVIAAEQKDEIITQVVRHGSLRKIDPALSELLPTWMHEVFVVAGDIAPEDHVRMQAEMQRYVCNSISKTINLPYEATVEDVMSVYMLGHRLGCRGLTVYRSGSRAVEVLTVGGDAPIAAAAPVLEKTEASPSCPDCGGALRKSEGCTMCDNECGFALCGR